jgi:hypothetical protein
MSTRIKKAESVLSRLRKSDLTSGRKFLSTPFIPKVNKTVYTQLGDPLIVFVCWACGSTKNLTTYHDAGGKLAACGRCKSGGHNDR